MDRFQTTATQRSAWYQFMVWGLGALVCVLSVVTWLEDFGWQIPSWSPYLAFPLLGLIAYGLMWSQYVAGFIQETARLPENLFQDYFRLTGWAVLALICLHPGLLIFQRFRDGFGLPPGSYESYVAPGLGWITLLGSVSLLIFLAYELYRWFDNRSWWQYVLVAVDLAMLAIFYHGLSLGDQTGHGWFEVVWWFYGVTLVAILGRKYVLLYQRRQNKA